MQRRAAAIYAAFLILIAAGAYTMIGFAQAPTMTLENPDHSLSQNDTFTVQDRTYRVAEIGETNGMLEWTQQGVEFTDTWENGSTVTLDGTDFQVRTYSTESPPRVQLTEERSVGENVTTTEIEGQTYVVVGQEGDRRLVPEEQYLRETRGPPETRSFTTGDTVMYNGETTTIDEITNSTVTLTWTGQQTNTERLNEGDVATLNGQEFVAHFPSSDQVVLTSDVQSYERQAEQLETFDERMAGLRGIAIVSGFFAILLISLSYLPSRY